MAGEWVNSEFVAVDLSSMPDSAFQQDTSILSATETERNVNPPSASENLKDAASSARSPGMDSSSGQCSGCCRMRFQPRILSAKQGSALSNLYLKLSYASRTALAGGLSTTISFYWLWSHRLTWFSIAQAIGSQRKTLVSSGFSNIGAFNSVRKICIDLLPRTVYCLYPCIM